MRFIKKEDIDQMSGTVDIVVPVYDGLKETMECVSSVLSTKNEMNFNLILINDASPNKNIKQYLETIAATHESVLLTTNPTNLGFVKTVNKGIQSSERDVILLNADTIVTDNWIDKLYAAAYSNPKNGTVTSLTNNGTISSVPVFNKDNKLPAGYSLSEFATLVENLSSKSYPIIPTAVGHCMYIKRELINKIGLFDEEAFGMGYGEENDFSFRAAKAGYKNILADDTFIFHYGSTSFKESKKDLIKKHKKILRKKHPLKLLEVKLFVKFNKSVRDICTTIARSV